MRGDLPVHIGKRLYDDAGNFIGVEFAKLDPEEIEEARKTAEAIRVKAEGGMRLSPAEYAAHIGKNLEETAYARFDTIAMRIEIEGETPFLLGYLDETRRMLVKGLRDQGRLLEAYDAASFDPEEQEKILQGVYALSRKDGEFCDCADPERTLKDGRKVRVSRFRYKSIVAKDRGATRLWLCRYCGPVNICDEFPSGYDPMVYERQGAYHVEGENIVMHDSAAPDTEILVFG